MSFFRPASPLFLGAQAPSTTSSASMAILGIPYDASVTYRGGAKDGPKELRAASDSLESYCPKLEADLEDFSYLDLGDMPPPSEHLPPEVYMTAMSRELEALPESLPLLAIGGDHLVAYPFLKRALRQHDNLQILHIDAHWDLREEWNGEAYNHASVIRLAMQHLGPKAKIHSWGIRSGLRAEYDFVRSHAQIDLLPRALESVLSITRALLDQGDPIYLTLDVDGLDPAELPGTGTPEPDGLRFSEIEALLKLLALTPGPGPGLIGADLVELAPALDPSGRSNVAAARLARGILLTLGLCASRSSGT